MSYRTSAESDPSSPDEVGGGLSCPVGDDSVDMAALDENCRVLYRALVRGPSTPVDLAHRLSWPLDRVRRTAGSLAQLRLLTENGAGELRVVRPEVAATAYLKLEQRVLAERISALGQVREQILSLLPVHDSVLSVSNDQARITAVLDLPTARSLLRQWSTLAQRRVRVVQPGPEREPHELDRAGAFYGDVLGRGVALCSLVPPEARRDAETHAYLQCVIAQGAEVRTTANQLPHIIIYDDDVAFMPSTKGDGAVMVIDPAVVCYLGRMFEMAWQGAQPYPVGAGEGSAVRSLHLALLNQLAMGRKDEQIARHLGLSLRTCRRHIATIMTELGAASRFQAGVVAVERALLGDSPTRTRA